MSIDTCKICGRFLDTDDHPDAYRPVANYTNQAQPVNGVEKTEWICICDFCVDEYADEYVDENGFFHRYGAPVRET